MDDRNPSDPRAARTRSERAKTLVVRCWREGSVADGTVLRGTVRDLSRGRAVGFEGFDRLVDLLGVALAAGDVPLLQPGADEDRGPSNGSTDDGDLFR